MVLPLGEVGIRSLPDEAPVPDVLKRTLRESGLYFPGIERGERGSPEAMQAFVERYRSGPTGILVSRPTGTEPVSAGQLATEFAVECLGAWLAALVLFHVRGGYFARAGLVVLIGLFAWLAVSVPYCNWFRFPGDHTLAAGLARGTALAGLALARIVRAPEARASEATAPLSAHARLE